MATLGSKADAQRTESIRSDASEGGSDDGSFYLQVCSLAPFLSFLVTPLVFYMCSYMWFDDGGCLGTSYLQDPSACFAYM